MRLFITPILGLKGRGRSRTVNYQLSTVNCQLSTVNCQLSTVERFACQLRLGNINSQLCPMS
ncbi:hypothetical protein [Microcoleus sp. CAWBG58]|uniref:hypothetical protein n=1 Tax=Microcoleus sp. CAWBG58 TaxID=2841651 RepID=UPI0025DD87F4|nr:hypothetical protein [Microcoleus sp. CAWBG58]